jgi:hypothetical protein
MMVLMAWMEWTALLCAALFAVQLALAACNACTACVRSSLEGLACRIVALKGCKEVHWHFVFRPPDIVR